MKVFAVHSPTGPSHAEREDLTANSYTSKQFLFAVDGFPHYLIDSCRRNDMCVARNTWWTVPSRWVEVKTRCSMCGGLNRPRMQMWRAVRTTRCDVIVRALKIDN